jgi:hypothetical protein
VAAALKKLERQAPEVYFAVGREVAMKLRGAMWIARVAAVSAMLTVGVANAGPVVNPGCELYETLSGTTFGGVAFQGVPIGTFNFGGGIGPIDPCGLSLSCRS